MKVCTLRKNTGNIILKNNLLALLIEVSLYPYLILQVDLNWAE